jgi:hypothetical protein
MKKIALLLVVLMSVTSCGTTSLYYWGYSMQGASAYEALSYKRADKESPKSICKVIEMYENLIANPGGYRQVPPPGICAEYAYMLLQPETMDIFTKNATSSQRSSFENSIYGSSPFEKAVKLFEKEMELYPESAQFVLPILKRVKSK